MPDTILIVDDETDLLRGLKRTIEMEIDCRVLIAENGPRALDLCKRQPVDVVLTDIRMPEMDGLALLEAIRQTDSAVTVIIMTAYGTIEKAVRAIKAGAYDFIQKPLDEDRLMHLLRNGLERNRLVRENARLMAKVCERAPLENMVGQSLPMQRVFHTICMLARTDVTVLILGATGTGKDLAAQAIHAVSERRHKTMVTVNCPALPESILESELFGYRKGAFTNADQNRKGLFDKADGGTIFLDEIGDLSPPVQTKLLRVLQQKEIKPLGDHDSHRVDVRIIAATNQNLKEKMEQGSFRPDLYYRLNVATLEMPSLNAIREDLPLLVRHFLKKAACQTNTPCKRVAPDVMAYLMERSWPGNVRELENTILSWNCMITADTITLADLPSQVRPSHPPHVADPNWPIADLSQPYKHLKDQALETFTLAYLQRLLLHTKGNVTMAAQLSGIKRQSLQKIIKRYDVDVEQFRST